MKKLLIALLVSGIVTSAMARYGYYDFRISGKFLEVANLDGGKYFYNGELDETFPKVVKRQGGVRFVIIEDEELGEQFVFFKDDEGVWEQDDANFSWDIYWENVIKESVNGEYKYSEKGVISLEVWFDMGDVYIDCNLIGNHAFSSHENGEFEWKWALQGNGAGIGWAPVDEIGEYTGIAIRKARIKYNNKLSHMMSDAYYNELDATEGDEAAAVAAAEEWLAARLGGMAEPDLPLDD